jgi:hypothetical protein
MEFLSAENKIKGYKLHAPYAACQAADSCGAIADLYVALVLLTSG